MSTTTRRGQDSNSLALKYKKYKCVALGYVIEKNKIIKCILKKWAMSHNSLMEKKERKIKKEPSVALEKKRK